MLNFSRRINGVTYYVGHIFLILGFIVFILLGQTPNDADMQLINVSVACAMLAILFVTVFYWLCLVRQRCNDITGKHPLLVMLAVFWVPLLPLLLGFVPGEKKKNQYGKVPSRGVKLN